MSEISSGLSEFDLIRRYLKPLTIDPRAFCLSDDAASLHVPEGKELVVTKDMLVAGVHFFPDDPPDLIARKALRANISDLIAKGAAPYRYSLGLGFPLKPEEKFIEAFASGLKEDQNLYDCSLIGGDTTRTNGDFVISITAYGLCDRGKMKTRLSAKPGDLVYVTGTLGDSVLGLTLREEPTLASKISREDQVFLDQAYLLPNPPLMIHTLIADFASASMDISDGLFGDARHIAVASGVTLIIEEETIPLSDMARRVMQSLPDMRERALRGGDDYQCLLCIDPDREPVMLEHAQAMDVKMTKIGHVQKQGAASLLVTNNGYPSQISLSSHEHF